MPKRKLKGLPKADVEAIFGAFAAVEPEPKGELEYVKPSRCWSRWCCPRRRPMPASTKRRALFKARRYARRKWWRSASPTSRRWSRRSGSSATKAKNVYALSQALVERFNAQVPQDREALESLPGVGRKTANVVLNIAFGAADHRGRHAPLPRRQPHRPRPWRDPLAVEQGLLKAIPEQYLLHAHHWLILHGRYVCKARKPECWRCVISREWCRFEPNTLLPKGA